MSLSEMIEDGEKILQLLENQEETIDTKQLLNLISLQAGRIRNMRSVIEKNNIATILGIHLPPLEDLQVLLDAKGNKIAILAEQFDEIKAMRSRPFVPYSAELLTHRGYRDDLVQRFRNNMTMLI